MDTGFFTKIAIGGVILILVVVMVVSPILNGITYTETAENTPTGYATSNIGSATLHAADAGFYIDDGETISVADNDWILISDSLVVLKAYDVMRIIDYATNVNVTATTITLADGTWTAGSPAVTGSIGNDPLLRSQTGEYGTYRGVGFTINKEDSATMWRYTFGAVTVSGTQYVVRALMSGPIDGLTVHGLDLYASPTNIFVDPDDCEASLKPESMTAINTKTFEIASNPQFDISFEYDGEDYSFTNSTTTSIAAPIQYTTEKHDAIESMMGLVPLLMIVGIITMLVGALIVRNRGA